MIFEDAVRAIQPGCYRHFKGNEYKEFGSIDAYLWSFTDGQQIDGHWKTPGDKPWASMKGESICSTNAE